LLSSIELAQLYPRRRAPVAIASDRMLLEPRNIFRLGEPAALIALPGACQATVAGPWAAPEAPFSRCGL
jgi:hypothetical protein